MHHRKNETKEYVQEKLRAAGPMEALYAIVRTESRRAASEALVLIASFAALRSPLRPNAHWKMRENCKGG